MTDDVYAGLESFDSEYHPEAATVRRAGLDSLADGDYRFRIDGARLDRSEKQGLMLFVMSLRTTVTNAEVEWTQVLKTQKNADILGSTLTRLGIPADKWPKFSTGLKAMIESNELVGLVFSAKKVTKDGHANLKNISLHGRPTLAASPTFADAPNPSGKIANDDEDPPF
jgi:hypothetical protein